MVTGRTVRSGDRKIGAGHPCFIIAEAGVNHNGDVELAKELVDIAADAGADAVKFQTFKAERLVSAAAPKADYQLRTTDRTESQLDMLRKLELSEAAHEELSARCTERNILFMSSAFDETSADLLDELGVAAFKIPSGEITNLPLLDHVARMGQPMIVSTGMSTLGEVETAVRTIRAAGNDALVLLHCVSNYPADPADVNLRAMATMATAFGMPVGYSDHTCEIEVPLAAVAMGACVIEKHLTVSRRLPGPDHRTSAEPAELEEMVFHIRRVESALGDGRRLSEMTNAAVVAAVRNSLSTMSSSTAEAALGTMIKERVANEESTAAAARKSLVAACDIPAGTTLTDEMIAVKRPGIGLPPHKQQLIVGGTTGYDIAEDTVLTLEMIEIGDNALHMQGGDVWQFMEDGTAGPHIVECTMPESEIPE